MSTNDRVCPAHGNRAEPFPRSGKLLSRHTLSTQFVRQNAPRAWSVLDACDRCHTNLKHHCQSDIGVQHGVGLYAGLIKEATDIGAEIIVTSCAACMINLRSGAQEMEMNATVQDLPLLLPSLLERKRPEAKQ